MTGDDERKEYFALHNAFRGVVERDLVPVLAREVDPDECQEAFGIFRTNAFLSETFAGVYPTLSVSSRSCVGGRGSEELTPVSPLKRVNHSCVPTAQVQLALRYDPDSSSRPPFPNATLRTLVDLSAGDEITYCYTQPLSSRSIRRKHVEHNWRFSCVCSSCSLPPQAIVESDERRKRIGKMVAVSHAQWMRRELSGARFLETLCEVVGTDGLMAKEGLVAGKAAYWGKGLEVAGSHSA